MIPWDEVLHSTEKKTEINKLDILHKRELKTFISLKQGSLYDCLHVFGDASVVGYWETFYSAFYHSSGVNQSLIASKSWLSNIPSEYTETRTDCHAHGLKSSC